AVPDLELPVTAGGQPLPVGREGDRADPGGVPFEQTGLLLRLRVPHLDLAGLPAADQGLAVRAEGHAPDFSAVRQLPLCLARTRVPNPERAVVGGAGQPLTVGAEDDTRDPRDPTADGRLLPRSNVPDPDGVVPVPVARRHGPAVGAERDGVDAA